MTIFNYTVNYIDVILSAILILYCFTGYKNGLLITILNFIKYAVGFFLSFYLSSNFSQPLYNSLIRPRAEKMIAENIEKGEADLSAYVNDKLTSLPEILKGEIDLSALKNTGDSLQNSVMKLIVDPVLLTVTKILIFAVVLLVFFIIASAIIHAVKKREKKKNSSPLKVTNKILGALIGLLKGLVFVLAITAVLMYIVNLNDDFASGNSFLTEASESTVLHFFDEINPFNAVTRRLI